MRYIIARASTRDIDGIPPEVIHHKCFIRKLNALLWQLSTGNLSLPKITLKGELEKARCTHYKFEGVTHIVNTHLLKLCKQV